MSALWPYLAALIPSTGIGVLFWIVIKNMIEGDRKERLAHSQWERDHRSGNSQSKSPEDSTKDQ